MDKDLKEQLGLIYNTLGEGQGLLELNDFEDYEERTEEFERGFEALEKVEAYINELEEKIDRELSIENAPTEEDVLANKGIDLNY